MHTPSSTFTRSLAPSYAFVCQDFGCSASGTRSGSDFHGAACGFGFRAFRADGAHGACGASGFAAVIRGQIGSESAWGPGAEV